MHLLFGFGCALSFIKKGGRLNAFRVTEISLVSLQGNGTNQLLLCIISFLVLMSIIASISNEEVHCFLLQYRDIMCRGILSLHTICEPFESFVFAPHFFIVFPLFN